MPTDSAQQKPPELQGYRVLLALGQGDPSVYHPFGVLGQSVWLAEEASGQHCRVAVRVGRRNTPEEQLLLETNKLKDIRSRYVAAFLGCTHTSDGTWAVITEYVDGVTLESFLASQQDRRLPWHPLSSELEMDGRALSWLSAASMIMDVLEGLKVLHTQDPPIVHRGIMPANIIIRDHRAVLTDIHLLSLCADLALQPRPGGCFACPSSEQLQGGAAGLMRYMSPELVGGTVGFEDLDARADIWAAGVVLHEALSGQRLFPQVDQ